MRDDDLRRHVAAELFWDPQVDSEVIDVSAAADTVTLRGTVASLRVKRAGGRPRPASAALPGLPMNCGCSSQTQSAGPMRTCAATCWKR
jgi:hypothetical protein